MHVKILSALALLLLLHACKHPLAIEGEGDIIERLAGQRGCSLEEFQTGSPRCTENEVSDEDYIVRYEAVARPGWRFIAWRGGTICGGNSVPPFCELNVSSAGVVFADENWPGLKLPTSLAVFGQPDTWAGNADIPIGGEGLSSCVIGGKIYVLGGDNVNSESGESTNSAVLAYDPYKDTWSTRSPMPTPRFGATASAVNGSCYVIGGSQEQPGGEETAIATVEEYNPKTDTWRARAPLSQARTIGGSAAVDNKIYVFGGIQSFEDEPPVLASVEIYDPASNSWTSGADMPTPRVAMGVAALNGSIYTVGGITSGFGVLNLDLVERYDPGQDSWTTAASMPMARFGLALSAVDGALYATGGSADFSIAFPTLEIYDPNSGSWSVGADISQARVLHSSVSLDGQVYVFGGTVIDGEEENETLLVEHYTP